MPWPISVRYKRKQQKLWSFVQAIKEKIKF